MTTNQQDHKHTDSGRVESYERRMRERAAEKQLRLLEAKADPSDARAYRQAREALATVAFRPASDVVR